MPPLVPRLPIELLLMHTHRGGFSLQDLPQDLPQDSPQSEQMLLPPSPPPRTLLPCLPGAAGPHTATGPATLTASFLMRLVVLHADKALAVLLFSIAVAVSSGRGGVGGCLAMPR